MTSPPEPVSLLCSPWTGAFASLVSSAEHSLLLASPFISRLAVNRVISEIDKQNRRESLRVALITDLRPESTLAGSMDLQAVYELGCRVPNCAITHLPSLHAKVFIADSRMAIVTSGNLTEAGLRGNIEYGVALTEERLVGRIRSDFERYAALGAAVALADVATLSAEMKDLRALFVRAQSSIRSRARRAFQEKLESTYIHLLRQRIRGKTPHAIFSDTIRFLLSKGPLKTSELHPLIQHLHPDLCDDSVDRIIDRVHFGKLWKHQVRSAQVNLRRQGEIRLENGRWHLNLQ